MPGTSMVKGVVIRGVFKDVKESYPGGIATFLESVPREIKEKDFAHNIVHGVWYSYEALTAMFETYLNVVARGRMGAIEELGSRAAQRDLGTMLKIFAAVSSPHRVGQHSASVWSQRFKDAGVMSMSDKQDRSFQLTLADFPDMHHLHCAFLTGYGAGVGQTWEKSFRVKHDRCVHKGGSNCRWTATW